MVNKCSLLWEQLPFWKLLLWQNETLVKWKEKPSKPSVIVQTLCWEVINTIQRKYEIYSFSFISAYFQVAQGTVAIISKHINTALKRTQNHGKTEWFGLERGETKESKKIKMKPLCFTETKHFNIRLKLESQNNTLFSNFPIRYFTKFNLFQHDVSISMKCHLQVESFCVMHVPNLT